MKFASPILFLASIAAAQAAPGVTIDRNTGTNEAAGFHFERVPSPRRGDACSRAEIVIVDGRRDPNGAGTAQLKAGPLPSEADQPERNFFFAPGDGGRLVFDFGKPIAIGEMETYSWHPDNRAAQVYTVYGSDGSKAGFDARPPRPNDPLACGWEVIASVDTRAPGAAPGGQHGVRIGAAAGDLGRFRYLLFDIHRTESANAFGNTFYSAINVIDREAPRIAEAAATEERSETFQTGDGAAQFTIDTSDAPDLKEWTRASLAPTLQEWYPKIVHYLASEGYSAPKRFTIKFSNDYRGVAATTGTHIVGASDWYRKNASGEAVGSMVHELVHVVQQYGKRPLKEGATSPPVWLVEGIADYVRWHQFEPQGRGASIDPKRAESVRYDGSYGISAHFLDWVMKKHGAEIVPRVNALLRQGDYSEAFWKQQTGRTLEELGEQWKAELIGAPKRTDG